MKLFGKRLISLLLSIVLVMSMLPMTAFAAEATEATEATETLESVSVYDEALANFEYTLDESEQTVTLTNYIGSNAAVMVADSYSVDGVAYAPVLDSGTIFRGNTTITSVTIGSGVRFKDNSMSYLFAECSKLTSVDLDDADTASVTDMSYLFYKCSALTELELSGLDTGKVSTMRGMFSYCTKLKTLSGYENWDTGSLESIYHMFNRMASSAGSIECIDLSNWDLDQVKNTGWCFQLCYAKEIKLPDNLAVMSAGFLNHATKVTGSSFTIPSGVNKIGYAHTIYDFATDDFVEFIVAEGNTNYQAIDGILYSADGTEMLAVPRGKTFENGIYEIPEGVTFLGELSFSRNYNMNTVVLPDSFEIRYVPYEDPEYVVFEDWGNQNAGTNLSIAIYCYTGIMEYAVKDSNPNYASQNGIIYSKDMTEVVAIPARYAQEIVIPEGVTVWNMEAMWADTDNNSASTLIGLLVNCPGVSIPASLASISEDQLAMLNLLYTSRVGTDNPFAITVAEGNTAFALDENEGLVLKTHAHTYEATVTAPTCTEQGYTTYTCGCGDSYVSDYVEAAGHSYENGTCTCCGATQPGPVITKQPTNGEAKLGELYCVTVEAEGEGLTYQWYLRNAGSTRFSKSSVRDNTYDDVMTAARAEREVYCVITDANGISVTTDTVKLVLLPNEELEIVTQPVDGEAVLGERYCVSVEAKGEGLKYQWYFRNAGATHWSKSGVTDNTYDDIMNNTRNGREVYCVVSDKFGNSVTTDIVKLVRVPMKLEITQQPADSSVHMGEEFCVVLEAKGEGLTYQWYYRNAGSESWSKSGVRDNTYNDIMTKARAGREVYCVITDQWGNSVTSEIAKLIAVADVELQLLDVTYDAAALGGRYCVSVNAQGDGLSYTWYFRKAGATRWSKSGVTDNTYDDVMNRTRANREVYCVITDCYGNQVFTDLIILTVEN